MMSNWFQAMKRREMLAALGPRKARQIDILTEGSMRRSNCPAERGACRGALAEFGGLDNEEHRTLLLTAPADFYPMGCLAVCRAAEIFGEVADDPTFFQLAIPAGFDVIAYLVRDLHWDDPTVDVRVLLGRKPDDTITLVVRALRLPPPEQREIK
jgi:hypothetical protein